MQQGNNESKGQVRATRIISNYEMLKSIEASGELNRPPVATPQVSFPSLNKAIEGFMGGELVVITGATGTIRDAVEKFKGGELKPTAQANVGEYFGTSGVRQGGMGRGKGGGGRGRG